MASPVTQPALVQRELPAILREKIQWYDQHARMNRSGYLFVRGVQTVLSAAAPVVALLEPNSRGALINGILGAIVVVLEGIQQLVQYQQNWIRYRSTCEALKREELLFELGAGAYASAKDPIQLLAERVEPIISSETVKWMSMQEQPGSGSTSATK